MSTLPDHATGQVVPLRSPLVGIMGGWRFDIPADHRRLGIVSPPNHLLHLMVAGVYTLTIEGKAYEVGEGDLLYYPPQATVEWLANASPVSFYSVCFAAPDWVYPGRHHVIRERQALAGEFACIVREAQAGQCTWLAQLQASRAMLAIMAHLQQLAEPPPAQTSSLADLWWEIEAYVKQHQDWHMPVEAMADLVARSRSTVHRACHEATDTSPADRVRELRLGQARDLLRFSPQSITSIAESLGYNRLQEFSREFHHQVGLSPSGYREQA